MKKLAIAISILFLGSFAQAQDQAKIDAAIRKGLDYLKGADSPPHPHSKATHSDELLLYTMVIGDVAPTNPRFKALLDRVLTDEPHQTYKVALQAMALEELDR
ncbi:MAG TPA: hypothetical protein VKU80_10320, partial [Planctomycetota bacterium]|nr:hypothetical protein [Planctomycetota bacterium]